MKARSWKVGLLAEFFPQNQNLLGININWGQTIKVRMRPHFDNTKFLEFDDIMGTMLHELAHIIHGRNEKIFFIKV